MGEAFVIMQIGNASLDRVYSEAIVPALTAAGLTPRRVDVHNSGRLLLERHPDWLPGRPGPRTSPRRGPS